LHPISAGWRSYRLSGWINKKKGAEFSAPFFGYTDCAYRL